MCWYRKRISSKMFILMPHGCCDVAVTAGTIVVQLAGIFGFQF